MGLRFEEAEPAAPVVEDIIVNGEKVGKVQLRPPCQYHGNSIYHATINLPGTRLTEGLLQGFGETKEDAVNDAVTKGIDSAHRVLAAISDFQQVLAQKEAPHAG